MTAAEQKRREAEKALALRGDNLPPALQALLEEAKILAYSNIVPLAYIGKPEAVFAIIQYGKELGIGPMMALQNIAYINNRPSLGSELRCAVAHRHPSYLGYKIIKSTDTECELEVYRKFPEPIGVLTYPGRFSLKDAEKAGLWPAKPDSAWAKWTRRMLFHRASAFAHQDAFPDVDTGMHTEEEMNPEAYARFQEMFMKMDNEMIERRMQEGRPMEDGYEATTEEPIIAPKRGRKPKSTVIAPERSNSKSKTEPVGKVRNATPRRGGKK